MSFGKMNTFISIVEKQFIQDEDGFKAETDATVAEVRAYHFTCAHCGKPFTAYGNAKRKYCSHTCYIADRYKGGGGHE